MAREERIGSPYKDLVFRTAGNIRVLVGDKYYSLGYSDTESSDKDNNKDKVLEKDIIVASSIEDYKNGVIEYPGDNKIIFIPGDSIYYTSGDNYYSFLESSTTEGNSTNTLNNIFDKTIYLNGNPPLVLGNNSLIKGLNAEYLEGHSYYEFLKKGDDIDFETISTSDGKFTVVDGKLTVDSIESKSIVTDSVSFNTVIGTISIGGSISIAEWSEWQGSKYIPYSYSVINEVYSLYISGGITTELSFIDLAKTLLNVENSDYNWELPGDNVDTFIQSLVTSDIIFKPKDVDTQWKTVLLNNGDSLYDYFSKKIYFGNPLDGSAFILTISQGTCIPGDTFSIEVNQEVDETRVDPINISAIVTYVGETEVCISTDFTSQALDEAQEVTNSYNISIYDEYGAELVLYTTNIKKYEFPDLEDPNYGYNLFDTTSLSGKSGIIGNLSGITDSFLGDLSGYGLYTGNANLVNPKIIVANTEPYIKLTNLDTSYIGKTSTGAPFLEVLTDGQGVIITHGFKLWPNGIFETAAIKIYSDGQVDIGDKSGDLIVEEDGTVKLIEHGKTKSSKSI